MLKKKLSTLFSIVLMSTILAFSAVEADACNAGDTLLDIIYSNVRDSDGFMWTVQEAVCQNSSGNIYVVFLDAY